MFERGNMNYLNEEILRSFSDEEKQQLFEDISNMYFKKNFGSVSKADLETYLFSFYIEHLLDNDKEFDDYTIGRDLGLTISRVRSLKERKELKYPRKGYDWKEDFLKCAEYAKYDSAKHLIKFTISDVNVIKDARNFFIKNGKYDEYQLNPTLFQCRLDTFIEMCELIGKEENSEFKIKLREDFQKSKELEEFLQSDKTSEKDKSLLEKFFTDSMGDCLKDILVNCSKEAIAFILEAIIPGSGIVKVVLERLAEVIKK